MKKNMASVLLGMFLDDTEESASRFIPKRPGFIRVVERRGELGKFGKRKSGKLVERLVDNSRYPGHVLREIRAGRVVNGHTNAQECTRRARV